MQASHDAPSTVQLLAQGIKRTRVLSEHVPEAPPQLWSGCLTVGPLLFFSGLTARGFDGKLQGDAEYEQAKYTFSKMQHLITEAGGVMNDIVKLTIFVTDIKQNTEVWRARREFFTGDFPACSLVEVRALINPETLVEIEGIAVVGSSTAAA